MKQIWLLFASLLILACANDNRPSYESVEIQSVFEDSLSIRAILPLDRDRVLFSSDQGYMGLIEERTPSLNLFKYDDEIVSFRSIARTKKAVFVLSIANPAVLYKIDFNGKDVGDVKDVYLEEGEKVFYDSMAFWNDMEGIAMGDPTDECLSIIITRDGGNHWEKLSCEVLPSTERGEAAFAASNSNIAIYENHAWIATGGKRARVFHTSDKGETWEVYDTPILQGKAMTGIYSIDFFNEKRGVIFGGDWERKEFNEGNKAVTTDGGKTWKLIANGKEPGFRSSVKFVPGGEGEELLAVGSEGMDYSDDFGESWRSLSKEGFYAVEFLNDSIAFVGGKYRIARIKFR